jgi:hypothetical protein
MGIIGIRNSKFGFWIPDLEFGIGIPNSIPIPIHQFQIPVGITLQIGITLHVANDNCYSIK